MVKIHPCESVTIWLAAGQVSKCTKWPAVPWAYGKEKDYEKFLLDSIFPTKLTEFPTKLTDFVPFIFIISQYCPTVKRILPDWLCLPNKLGGGAAAPRPVRPWAVQFLCNLDSDRKWMNITIVSVCSISAIAAIVLWLYCSKDSGSNPCQ
jgi:hypothetical protein